MNIHNKCGRVSHCKMYVLCLVVEKFVILLAHFMWNVVAVSIMYFYDNLSKIIQSSCVCFTKLY